MGALYINVLTFTGVGTAPDTAIHRSGDRPGDAAGSAVLALLANPGVVVRPNIFLTLLTMLAVLALMASLHNEFVFASTYRAGRLVLFVVVLWLLTVVGQTRNPLLQAHLLFRSGSSSPRCGSEH